MKKIILHGFAGIFCFAAITSCSKDVKTPYSKRPSAAKTTSSPVTQTTTPSQGQNNHTCGGQSGTNSSQSGTYNSQSGTYNSQGY